MLLAAGLAVAVLAVALEADSDMCRLCGRRRTVSVSFFSFPAPDVYVLRSRTWALQQPIRYGTEAAHYTPGGTNQTGTKRN